MKKKWKLGIVSLLLMFVMIIAGMTALLQDVSPKGNVSAPAGKKVELRALAAAGAAVTASVNGQTVTLSATSEQEDGGYWYTGTYTIPKSAEGTDLGTIRFTAQSGSRTETRIGGDGRSSC